MERKFIKIFIAFVIFILPVVVNAQQEIKVMSYNIRLDVKSDGENQWDKRKDKVAGLMNYYEADFIGGQEVQHHQLQYLLQNLNGYSYIGVGRDDGKEAGEYSCIFYKKDKFDVVQQSTFWLSPTPDSVSKGWDAAYNRVCTYALFKDLETKKKPSINFLMTNGTVTAIDANTYSFKGQGNLTIAGTTRLTDLNATLKYNAADKSFTCSGSKVIKMTDWKVTPPTVLFGTIKTGDQITIQYNLKITK